MSTDINTLTDEEYAERVAFTFGLSDGFFDEEYQNYLSRYDYLESGDLDYQDWLNTCKEIEELNAAYLEEVEPHYSKAQYGDYIVPSAIDKRHDEYMCKLGWLEALLRA